MTWTCTIPAGKTFIASNYVQRIYTVQPADGSWCLRDHRANPKVAQYATNIFSSYTAHHYTQVVLNAQGYVPENFIFKECNFDKCPGRWIIMLSVHTLHCLLTVLREALFHLSRNQHPADALFCDSQRRSSILPFGADIALIVLICVAVVAISSVAIFMIVRWRRRRFGAAPQGHNAQGKGDGSGGNAQNNGSAGGSGASPQGHSGTALQGHSGAAPQGHNAAPQGHNATPQGHNAAPQGHNALPQGHGQVGGSGENVRITGSAENYELGPVRGENTVNGRLTPLAI